MYNIPPYHHQQIHQHQPPNPEASPLFDLLLLQLDGLVVDKDTLTLVGFWYTPLPDLGGEGLDLLFVDALKQDSRRLRCAGLDALGDAHLDGVGETELEADELLAGVFLLLGAAVDGGSVTNTDQTQHGRVPSDTPMM